MYTLGFSVVFRHTEAKVSARLGRNSYPQCSHAGDSIALYIVCIAQ